MKAPSFPASVASSEPEAAAVIRRHINQLHRRLKRTKRPEKRRKLQEMIGAATGLWWMAYRNGGNGDNSHA